MDWQSFVDKIRWADFFFDRNENGASDTLGDVFNDLGPFSIKADKRAPISKGVALRAYKTPRSNLPLTEYRALGELRSSNDIVVRMQDEGFRFVTLDRQDYIQKVKSSLIDGSFDILPSDPSATFYQIVKSGGDKWIEGEEIFPLPLECIFSNSPRPGNN